jgi:hypothetical protein
MSRRTMALIAVVALLTFAVMASGCAQIAEQAAKSAVESATGVKVDESNNSVSIKGAGGGLTASTDGKLPEGFPEDMPVYENGTIATGISSKSDKGTGFLVGIDTADTAGDVFDWYDAQLKDEGWTVKTSMKTDDGGLLGGEKGTTSFTIAVGPGSGGKTSISISLSPKP